MASGGPTIEYRRYRAPQTNGEVFFDPPLAAVPRVVHDNRLLVEQSSVRIFGQSLAHLAAQARHDLVNQAYQYTRQYSDVQSSQDTEPFKDAPVLMSGHQPQLFHPGVWFKNFVLDRLATSLGAVAINLVVDNDAAGLAAVRVPGGSVDEPIVETIAYDDPVAEAIPFEERSLQNTSLFNSFGERVSSHLKPLVPEPLVLNWWPRAQAIIREERNLGRCLARARHETEIQWGAQTLELPLSDAMDTVTFRRFTSLILQDLARFQDVYNRMLREYRRVNQVRSRSHPAPELQQVDEWREAPFWIWNSQNPQRRRLFVREAEKLELTDRASLRFELATSRDRELGSLEEQLAELSRRGIKIRPRALITTMFARMFLCDLFIHGIGGGKYDQLTDAILEGYFGMTPPKFLVTTATLRLPIERPEITLDDLRNLERELRELDFNPDRHLEPTEASRPHIAAKRRWLETDLPRGSRKARHQAITSANAALQSFVAPKRHRLVVDRNRLERLLRNERLLGSREYAFCLYPAAALQSLLLDKS